MIASIASECLVGGKEDASAVAQRLFSSSLLFSQAQSIGSDAFVDHAFSLLGTTERAIGYHLLISIISCGIKDGRMGGLFDRLPSLIISVSSQEEAESLSSLIGSILDVGAEDMMSYLNKALTKIVNSCNRLASKAGKFTHFALSVLQQLSVSRLRSSLLTSSAGIKQTCVDLLHYSSFYKEASILLASMLSLENAPGWMNYWVQLSRECNDLLQNQIGVHVSVNKALASPCSLPAELSALTGCRKAIAVEVMFSSKCQVLADMLRVGCSTGPVQLDLTVFIPTLLATLSLTLSLAPHDTKCTIANEQGVSPADLCLVSSNLKLSVMAVLAELLRSKQAGLARVASAICRPLLAMLAGTEMRISASSSMLSAMYLQTLECVGLACKSCPAVVARNSTGLQALVDLFATEMNAISTYRGALGQEYGVEEESGNGCGIARPSVGMVPKWTSLMQTIETLLIFCGPLLPNSICNSIEASIGQALFCMNRGLLVKHGSEKKSKRSSSELIRHSAVLQACLLRLALADILTSQRNGVMSGNMAVLKSVSEAAVHQPETCSAAMCCSLALEALLLPTAVALPAIPASSNANDYLMHRSNGARVQNPSVSSASVDTSMEKAWNETQRKEEKRKASTEKAFGKSDGNDDSAKRRKSTHANESSAAQPAPLSSPRINILASAMGPVDSKGGDDGDDDGDLPDLDVDTAPER